MTAPIPPDEDERLLALQSYNILDTPSEEVYDDITQLAASICGTPISAITLIDTDRQWFKSKVGLDVDGTSRDDAFCAHTILQPDLFVVSNALEDSNFRDNPLVTGDPHIRFYAGATLISSTGHALGALCVIDREPHILTEQQMQALRVLRRTVVTQFELRRQTAELTEAATVSKKAEEALRESEEQFRAIFSGAASGIGLIGSDGRFFRINKALENILRFTEKELAQIDLPELSHPDDLDEFDQNLRLLLGGSTNQFTSERRYYRKDGKLIWVYATFALVRNSKGEPHFAIAMLNDITETKHAQQRIAEQMEQINRYSKEIEAQKIALELANQKLESLATTDGMTGLRNHRNFQFIAEKEFAKSKDTGMPMSIILLDVDRFKDYNDTFGHPAGDQILKNVARLLKEHARSSDIVARYGGEEFVVLSPRTDRTGAKILAERFRAALESDEWPNRQITASFGVSTFTIGTQNHAQMIAEADMALYSSKHGGRNQVSHFADLIPDLIAT